VKRLVVVALFIATSQALSQDAARALARSGHYGAAIALYDSVLAKEPRNWDAALGRAQTIAWSGHLDQAESIYRALVDSGAGPDAQKGLARVVAWRGRLSESVRIYNAIIAHGSSDAEALTGLAQVLQWQGRPHDARAALKQALKAHPDDGDAREAWAKLRPMVSPWIRPTVTTWGDNEDNSGEAGMLAAVDGPFTFAATYRNVVGARDVYGHTQTDRLGLNVTAGHFTLRADGGVGLGEGEYAQAIGAAHVSVTLGPMTVTAGGARELFDETAAMIASGLTQTMADAAIDIGGHMTGTFGYATVSSDAHHDERVEGSMYLWSGAWHGLALGAGAHGYGYLRPDTTQGYFTPASYILGEGVLRMTLGEERGFGGTLELGAGAQRIAAFSQPASIKPAERVNATVLYRFAPGVECGVNGGYAVAASPNATSAAAAGAYRGYFVGLVARVIP
jgi:tetratricopeptide (TPR) repeat protein